jgi:ADP-heptose:LPS heptosyltransferase
MRTIVVNTSRIGDLVSGMGVATFLRDRFGEVFVLPDTRYAAILEGEPCVRTVTPEEARSETWDLLLDLSSSLKSERIVRKIRARRKICLWRTPLKLIRSLFFYTTVLRREDRHIVKTYQPVLRYFGEHRVILPVLTDNRNERALRALEELRGVEGRGLAGIHFDAASERRILPETLALGVIDRLHSLGMAVLLIGTSGDLARRLEELSGDRARYREFSLGELKTVIAGLDLFVGTDSGPLHIAAALGTPSIGIYGPNVTGWSGPLAPNVRIIELPLVCRPCNQNRPCPHGVRCLAGITPDMVEEKARSLLFRGG